LERPEQAMLITFELIRVGPERITETELLDAVCSLEAPIGVGLQMRLPCTLEHSPHTLKIVPSHRSTFETILKY
jgi:hypothetical protein